MGNICFGTRGPSTLLKPGLHDDDNKKRKTSKDPLVSPSPSPSSPATSTSPSSSKSTAPSQQPPAPVPVPHIVVSPTSPQAPPKAEPSAPGPSKAPAHTPAPHVVVSPAAPHAPPKAEPSTPAPSPAPPVQEPHHAPQVPVQPTPVAPKVTPPPEDEQELLRRQKKIQIFEQLFESDTVVGQLAKDRLHSLLEQMGITDRAVHEFLWKHYDTNFDGKVSFQEFCQMMFDVMDIKKSFELADLNQDRSISSTEIVTVLNKLNIHLEEATIAQIINLFDTNQDRGIDFSEFFPLSIFLNTLEYQYKEFVNGRDVSKNWLQSLLGGDDKKEAVLRSLEAMRAEEPKPTMDAFVSKIVSASSSGDFKDFKAPAEQKDKEKEKVKRPQTIIKPPAAIVVKRFESEELYEDHSFALSDAILPGRMSGNILWKRPKEINPDNHQLFVDGVAEGDVIQGSLGDCWFLGALAVVAASRTSFVKEMFAAIQPDKGYYVVKFFKDGDWVQVEVDDRLPCHASRENSLYLACASCKDPSEFWVPIVEKAYAKLHGSYTALEGGSISDALKDLTGGAIETIRWKEGETDQVWEKIREFAKREKCLMGCAIDAPSEGAESKLSCGLLQNHAYSIIKSKIIEVDGKEIRLLRIRNPWGQTEWEGDWSDNSRLWDHPDVKGMSFISEYSFEDDGTFYMSFDDFAKYFNRVFVMRTAYHAALWNSKGEWKGEQAQGCRNNPFWLNNPQYGITITEPNTKVFINLSQPDLRYSLKTNPESYTRDYESIGLYILKTDNPRFKKMVYRDSDKATATSFAGVRDTSLEFEFANPGSYVMLPCTYHAKKEANYHISIYTADGKKVEVSELPGKTSKTINSSWEMGTTAGGCTPNYKTTFMNNPQFLLKLNSKDTVDIVLAQSTGKPNYFEPIGIYVFAAMGDHKLKDRPASFVLKPEYMEEHVSVSVSLNNIDAHESYIIMPATMEPAPAKFSLTVISEHIEEFRLL